MMSGIRSLGVKLLDAENFWVSSAVSENAHATNGGFCLEMIWQYNTVVQVASVLVGSSYFDKILQAG